MTKTPTNSAVGGKAVNLDRHRRNCTICAHAQCEEIERDIINWKSPAAITTNYGLTDRTTVYRHAYAFSLFAKRQRNVRFELEKIIEKADEVEVTSATVVAAVQAYAKINAQGQWIDRSEHLNLNELFDRMTRDEMEAYAKGGTLPEWLTQTVTRSTVE